MKLLLRLRAWQLFPLLLLLSLPFVRFDAVIGQIINASWPLLFSAWIYSIGREFNSRLPDQLALSPLLFKVAFVPPLLYWGSGRLMGAWAATPLELVALACLMYVLWFSSRALVTYELGRRASFLEYVGPVFLFLVYPIGVWILQPKVNALEKGLTPPAQGNRSLAVGAASLTLAVLAYIPAATVFPAALSLSFCALVGGIVAAFNGAPRTGVLAILVVAATVPPSPLSPIGWWLGRYDAHWLLGAPAVLAFVGLCLAIDYRRKTKHASR